MELRHLRYFVAVAEELHFGRAAARLHISQPPLSQQIQALEAELGVRLFLRDRRRVRLTAAGETLLAEARALLARAEHAANVTRLAGHGETGMLRIGFTGSLPFSRCMPDIIRRFRKAYPHVRLHLRETGSQQQMAEFEAGNLDVGFVRPSTSLAQDRLPHLRLLREPLVAILPAAHPLAGRARLRMGFLRGEAFITYASRLGSELTERLLAMCLHENFTPTIVQEVYEMPTILGLVSAGLGVSIVADSMRQVQMEGVVYVPIDSAEAFTDVLLVWRGDPPSPLVDNFVATARAAMAQGLDPAPALPG